MVAREHKLRIQNELRNAGATLYGLLKAEGRHLPHIINHDEHIEAIAYGRYPKGSCMLVATDSRIVFLDKKPLFTFFDEVMYDIVSGVACSTQGYFAAVTLHTRFNDFCISFVNSNAAKKFVDYIEHRRIKNTTPEEEVMIEPPQESPAPTSLSDEQMAFLSSHKLGTLSTTDRTGNVHGSVVNYHPENNQAVYILIKPDSTKARNIFAHRHVALTVYDESMQTLQIRGTAEIESDPDRKKRIAAILLSKGNGTHYGSEEAYHLIRIVPVLIKFSDHRISEPSVL